MDNKQLKKSFEQFCIKHKELGHKPGEVKKSVVYHWAVKFSNKMLESRGDPELEAREAIALARTVIWQKLEKEELEVEDMLKNSDAFWMQHFKSHIKNFILTRYARRSHKKTSYQIQQDCQESKSQKFKTSRYEGARFEVVEERHESELSEDIVEPVTDIRTIRNLLKDLGIGELDIKIIELRTQDKEFKEIGEIVGLSEDAVRMRFTRATKKFGIDRAVLED